MKKYKLIRSVSGVGGVVGGKVVLRCIAGLGLPQKPVPKGLVHFFGIHAFERVHSDQAFDHMARPFGDVLVDVLELSFANLVEKLVLLFGPEGVVALQHHEEEDAQTP